MTAENRKQARSILATCKTLAEAEDELRRLRPMPSPSFSWGLWDGFRGWPCTLAGVESEENGITPKAQAYYDGYEEGLILREART